MTGAITKPTALLHIGLPKTGTTSLQDFLWSNERTLAAKGVVLGTSAGRPASRGLVAYAADQEMIDDVRLALGVAQPADVPAYREALKAAVDAEGRALSDDAKFWVFTSEHCVSRLFTVEELERLRDLLAPYVSKILVVCYLRRQVDLTTSHYSTRLKGGFSGRRVLDGPLQRREFLDYFETLTLWGSVFGDDAVMPRLLQRDALVGGDLYADFLSLCGVETLDGLELTKRRNISVSAAAQRIIRLMNERFPRRIDGVRNLKRGRLAHILAAAMPGDGRRPSRSEAAAYQAGFAASDEAVRARWFPDRERLFSEDLSDYPEIGDSDEPTAEELTEAMVALWSGAMGDVAQRERTIASLRAELLCERGELTAAAETLRKALRKSPDHSPHAKALADVLRRIGEKDRTRRLDQDAASEDTPRPAEAAHASAKSRPDDHGAAPGAERAQAQPQKAAKASGRDPAIERGGAITRDDVADAFRLLLGRAPESDAVVAEKMAAADLSSLVDGFLRSPECAARHPSLAATQSRDVMIEHPLEFRLWINLADLDVSGRILANDYEPGAVAFSRATLRPGDSAIDLGANIGFFTQCFACFVQSSGTVVSFEPMPHLFDMARKSIRENGFDHVDLHRIALGAEEGRATLTYAPGSTNWGGAYLDAGAPPPHHEQIVVDVAKLDRFISSNAIHLMKVDIEGAEHLVLKASRDVLTSHRPPVMSEIHRGQLQRVSGVSAREYVDLMADIGYQCRRLKADGTLGRRMTGDEAFDVVNVVFTP